MSSKVKGEGRQSLRRDEANTGSSGDEQTALDRQEGGNHYKSLSIQPVEYAHKNGMGFIEGSVVKYITRWRSENNYEDLRKAKHFIDMLLELEGDK